MTVPTAEEQEAIMKEMALEGRLGRDQYNLALESLPLDSPERAKWEAHVPVYRKHWAHTIGTQTTSRYDSSGGREDLSPIDVAVKPLRIYVAGPYTNPDPGENTHNAIIEANRLSANGYVPFVPHMTLLWALVSPKPYEEWMAWDHAWLEVCDAVVRLPGASSGSDRECAWATDNGVPVYEGVDAFLKVYGARDPHRFDPKVVEPVGTPQIAFQGPPEGDALGN